MRPLQSRHMTRILVILIACLGLAVGCGNDDDGDAGTADRAPAGGTAAEPVDGTSAEAADEGVAEGKGNGEAGEPAGHAAPEARRGPRVTLRDSQFGPVLFDGRNRALYLFTRDPRNKTRCYGACAEAWPPFYAKGRPRAGSGVDRSLLGTIKRRDGRRQVTYKGQALYFYVADPRGQVLCNDVFEFGGTWYAVDAKGNPPA
jgi:predicted lipoprotein with Yx(FWY)xxD motif